eukprot:CAMPEP_0172384426 /NCGR_PEP_ID=MMETSP1061-20121228/2194_1 /TAXON_ID=37318 /ORGANISM="Pseudo-nitzschia pungens, Strain cf. pungens" /LENGTH=735 /DNA_ID=CAMNT_0013113047 /DNA_START=56 /DNA_END=2260 /DNA_ORIENTATION=+
MAEHVQAALDRMVAPLRDLMDRHIFSEDEIRAIVTRRRESEYLLRRRAARKADFIRYIEAEMLLEKLRVLRTARRKRDHRKAQRERGIVDENENDNDDNDDDDDDDDETKQKKKNSNREEDPIGDVHIVQHIHLLFVRAIRKFRGDLSLHLQHAEFCKSVRSWTRLSRVYAEALQVFPREAGIWIEAASHEFFGPNRSVKSARVLMQRALRLNGSSSEELWIQYFSLELHYAQTLKGRRKILHGQPDEGGPTRGAADDDDDDEDDDGNSHDFHKVPMVVLRNAIRSIPDNVRFRLKFLDICQEFPDTTELMDYVQTSMETDFAKEPESWIARAMYQRNKQVEVQVQVLGEQGEPSAKRARTSSDSDNDSDNNNNNNNNKYMDPVISVLEEAIQSLETNEMLLQAFRFVTEYREEVEQQRCDSEAGQRSLEEAVAFIRTLWEAARDLRAYDAPSAELAMEQTRYLLDRGQEEEALQTIRTYCTKRPKAGTSSNNSNSNSNSNNPFASAPIDAWLLWASLSSSSSRTKQKNILERALGSISIDTHPDYVIALLQYLGIELKLASEKNTASKDTDNDDDDNDDEDDEDDDKGTDNETALFEILQKLLLLSPKTVRDVCIDSGSTGLDFEIKDVVSGYAMCLEHFYQRRGLTGARTVYEAVLFRSTATATVSEDNVEQLRDFVDRCLELERTDGKDAATGKQQQLKILRKLYDKAIDIFSGTPLEDFYREERNENSIFA